MPYVVKTAVFLRGVHLRPGDVLTAAQERRWWPFLRRNEVRGLWARVEAADVPAAVARALPPVLATDAEHAGEAAPEAVAMPPADVQVEAVARADARKSRPRGKGAQAVA